jgi:hypothetical protein
MQKMNAFPKISKEIPDRFIEYLIFEFAEHELASVL